MVKRMVDREKTESGIGGNAIACQALENGWNQQDEDIYNILQFYSSNECVVPSLFYLFYYFYFLLL